MRIPSQVIIEGLEWLIEKILDNYENISKGVEQALKKLREKQAQERLERQHRLALASVDGKNYFWVNFIFKSGTGRGGKP